MSSLLQTFLRRYAHGEARALTPHIRGRRLLDLGAGEGWVSAAVRALTPAWTCAADIGPFRLSNDPYVIYDGQRLPFGEGTFDTTLISLVLHHCATPEPVVAEAVRVTRTRLLVVESVYRNRFERFWLDLLDARLNRHRHGGRMPVPLSFKSPEEMADALRVTRPCRRHHGMARLGRRATVPPPAAVRAGQVGSEPDGAGGYMLFIRAAWRTAMMVMLSTISPDNTRSRTSRNGNERISMNSVSSAGSASFSISSPRKR